MRKRITKDERVTLLMCSWRDIKNPLMGGAEVYTHEILKRLDAKKYRVYHISPMFDGAAKEEIIDGVTYIRTGSIKTIIFRTIFFYWENRKNIDYVIDQCNAFRFFSSFWASRKKRIYLEFQLYRELWGVMASFPISVIGRLVETPLLRLNRKDNTITESASVRDELVEVGFDKDKVKIIPIGLDFTPWDKEKFCDKECSPTFIFVGRCVKSKGIIDLLEAFGRFKQTYSDAKVWIVGNCKENMLKGMIPTMEKYNLSYGKSEESDVVLWGFVSEEKKLELLSKSTAQVFPSMREGWGMVITEAAAVGTPSIVYKTTGCCDAVDYGKTGYLCESNSVEELLEKMISTIENQKEYEIMREAAYEFSKKFTWDESALIFEQYIESLF